MRVAATPGRGGALLTRPVITPTASSRLEAAAAAAAAAAAKTTPAPPRPDPLLTE